MLTTAPFCNPHPQPLCLCPQIELSPAGNDRAAAPRRQRAQFVDPDIEARVQQVRHRDEHDPANSA